jgi:carnitine O-palmitoyltransferase 1, liver isoform
MLEYKQLLDQETLKPMMIRGTVPMCMWQYERMFSTTRIPGQARLHPHPASLRRAPS